MSVSARPTWRSRSPASQPVWSPGRESRCIRTASTNILLPLGRDRLVDDLAELDPGVLGCAGILALDLVLEPRCLPVLRQDLIQDRLCYVAALDDELCAALELLKNASELIVMGREQLLGHRVFTGQDRPEVQWQDGDFGGGRVQDFPMGLQIV